MGHNVNLVGLVPFVSDILSLRFLSRKFWLSINDFREIFRKFLLKMRFSTPLPPSIWIHY